MQMAQVHTLTNSYYCSLWLQFHTMNLNLKGNIIQSIRYMI